MTTEEEIRAVLSEVMDPEIPVVSVLDLGIVRSISDREVVITPTYSGCPATVEIHRSIRNALDSKGFSATSLKTELSPPWTTDWITDTGKAQLKAYGIAPPYDARTVACPQCGSLETQEVSRFGSTPCKSQWRCLSCLEPFDRFKCH